MFEVCKMPWWCSDPSCSCHCQGKLLGKGGFAKCYMATCQSTQKNFAMKIVLKSTLTKPKAKQKLQVTTPLLPVRPALRSRAHPRHQAEIKIHSSLRHKHVVQFLHCFEDRSSYYMLLELCHNHSFSELMRRRKRLSEPEVTPNSLNHFNPHFVWFRG